MQQQINIKYQVRTKKLKISHCKGPSIYVANREDKQGFPGSSVSKESPPMQETRVQSLGLEDPLEKEMATHSSILAWEVPWTEEPGRLQSMGLQRVGHNLAIKQQTSL